MTMRLAIIGDGKMGRAIGALAADRGHEVTATLGIDDNRDGAAISRERLGDPEVVLEFTEPSSATANVIACIRGGLACVTGTTGWYADLPMVIEEVERAKGTLLWAPNFSVGVALLTAAAETVARALHDVPGFDAHVVETHHSAKKDRPSGTGAALAEAVAHAMGRSVDVSSVRVGQVPGTHDVIFDGAFEQVRLTHEARDRRVFADGALRAAEWVRGRRGVFTMRDVLQPNEESR